MANIDITKKERCLMANDTFNIDEIDELEPQITFDELQNAFEELFHDCLKSCKKKKILLQNKLDVISKVFDVVKKQKECLVNNEYCFKRPLDSLKNASNSFISNE